ncbi:PREDICTED: P2Y purinoceptor 2 [Nanorana parkeri]|uniref:P2Y purinoceptor 2 n=1 Tax=Nanorana parkeri TaxID=125878 RepID=UPI000853FE51|nr:PREDICTED: P2Y purinoceptor 2 [Nanorana parkeri]
MNSTENENSTYRCTFDEDFKYLLLPVSYGIVFCVGFVLNILALYIFLFRIKPWNASTTYMFNLAISDMMYVISLPLLIYYYSQGDDWPFGVAMCKIVRFLFYTNLYCSILFLLCISIHRFIGICFPMKSLVWLKVRNARIICVVVWLFIVAFQCPILYFVTTSKNGEHTICHDTSRPDLFDTFVIYSSVSLALLFCVPFVTILICYALMTRTLMQPSASSSDTSNSKKKSIKMIIIVLLVFIICFLPFHVNRTLYYYFRKLDLDCSVLDAINIAYKVTRPLASVNSCLDPILYFLAGQSVRRNILPRNGLTKVKSKFSTYVRDTNWSTVTNSNAADNNLTYSPTNSSSPVPSLSPTVITRM